MRRAALSSKGNLPFLNVSRIALPSVLSQAKLMLAGDENEERDDAAKMTKFRRK
jgi:hypothetical protein